MDALPLGSFDRLEFSSASNFGSFTLTGDNVLNTAEFLSIGSGTADAINPWTGKTSLRVTNYKRLRKASADRMPTP